MEEIFEQIQEHLRQERNVALDRVAFDERKQETRETFDEFYVAVKNLAEESNLCDNCVEQRLTTKIMSGIKTLKWDDCLILRLFLVWNRLLIYAEAKNLLQKTPMHLIRKLLLNEYQITSMPSEKIWQYALNEEDSSKGNSNSSSGCMRCGFTHDKNSCPASNSTCNYCQKKGHWKKMCLKLKRDNESKLTENKIDKKYHQCKYNRSIHVLPRFQFIAPL